MSLKCSDKERFISQETGMLQMSVPPSTMPGEKYLGSPWWDWCSCCALCFGLWWGSRGQGTWPWSHAWSTHPWAQFGSLFRGEHQCSWQCIHSRAMVVPEKSDLGIKMKLGCIPPICYLPGCSSYTAASLVFRGCFKPGLHLGTAIASFFAGTT